MSSFWQHNDCFLNAAQSCPGFMSAHVPHSDGHCRQSSASDLTGSCNCILIPSHAHVKTAEQAVGEHHSVTKHLPITGRSSFLELYPVCNHLPTSITMPFNMTMIPSITLTPSTTQAPSTTPLFMLQAFHSAIDMPNMYMTTFGLPQKFCSL